MTFMSSPSMRMAQGALNSRATRLLLLAVLLGTGLETERCNKRDKMKQLPLSQLYC